MIRHDLNLDYIDFYCGQCECDLRFSFNNEGQPYFQTAKELLVNNDESVKNFVCHQCFIHCTNDAAKHDENFQRYLSFCRMIKT